MINHKLGKMNKNLDKEVRTCENARCESQMVEDMAVMVTNKPIGIEVREQGMFKMPLEKIKCAVCPNCGYVETYVEVSHFIKKLADKYE